MPANDRRVFYFWVKFDKDPRPEKIAVRDFLEFQQTIERMVLQRGDFPEWIIRDYTR